MDPFRFYPLNYFAGQDLPSSLHNTTYPLSDCCLAVDLRLVIWPHSPVISGSMKETIQLKNRRLIWETDRKQFLQNHPQQAEEVERKLRDIAALRRKAGGRAGY
ncbi:hypothetical protein Hypma_003146 [Hypsizygus marmoreus]|uniref:Uncharacterized protein n=1 Tax=Hypsizygus marmoreus TaxID=39966 RepID=A0A369JZ53_HYPMA|nr:hypothetical protein Hypma_003146 [Hypsizygus marmoreus]